MTNEQAIRRVIEAWRDAGISMSGEQEETLAEIAVEVLWDVDMEEKREPGGASAGAGNETKPPAQGSRSVSGVRLDGAEVASPPLAHSPPWPTRGNLCSVAAGPFVLVSPEWMLEVERRIVAVEDCVSNASVDGLWASIHNAKRAIDDLEKRVAKLSGGC